MKPEPFLYFLNAFLVLLWVGLVVTIILGIITGFEINQHQDIAKSSCESAGLEYDGYYKRGNYLVVECFEVYNNRFIQSKIVIDKEKRTTQ